MLSHSPCSRTTIKHNTVHSATQPLLKERAALQAPSTPTRRHGPFQSDDIAGPDSSDDSTSGGVPVSSSEIPVTPVARRTNPKTPSSSVGKANISRRRTQYSSMLLRSPARPGHSTRMKQIFEVASLEGSDLHQDAEVSYPRLANISSTYASPGPFPTHESRGTHTLLPRSGVLVPSAGPPPIVPDIGRVPKTPIQPCRTPSQSWSDDSGYLIAEPPIASSHGTVSSKAWIDDWLARVSHEDDPSSVSTVDSSIATHQQYTSTGSARNLLRYPKVRLQRQTHEVAPSAHPPASVDDPFLSGFTVTKSIVDGLRKDPKADRLASIRSKKTKAKPKHDSPPRSASRRHVSDVCKVLDFDPSSAIVTSHTLDNSSTFPAPSTPVNISTPEQTTGADDDMMQLTPLSSNVCIERGPSRCHSIQKSQAASQAKDLAEAITWTPTRTSDFRKENAHTKIATPWKSETPQTLRSARRTTRFSRPPGGNRLESR
ncbi:hypothetical protein BDV95DRAFT_136139 [Massariosphaeria phaeospora]|uniref:Uncharacterized protein n=1 Tax=Massariosphaeria phaeospora TaxID=100035 RepID=A0A7C8IH18_9PLEO|nr:hypothetical protein BDV95DRAFT_136139 [Massariosphaeria phaeospora]